MNSTNKTSRLLGAAFLAQFVVSVSAMITGLMLKAKCVVPGNIGESMINIANNTGLLNANVLGEMLTTITLIFLASMLYVTLKKQNGKIALVALGFYILAASILAVSRFANYYLLRISQEYLTAGHAAYLQTMGDIALKSMDYGVNLMQLPICLGAVLFYYLLYKSRIVPRILSLYGLIIMFILAIATPFTIFGYEIPFFLMILYAPFEPVITVWLLVKGVKEE